MTLTARLLTAAALLAVTGAALISGASGAQAATFVVTTSDDGADVSLGDGVCDGSPEVSVDCTPASSDPGSERKPRRRYDHPAVTTRSVRSDGGGHRPGSRRPEH